MTQNPQMQQQFQRISQQISQTTQSVEELIGQSSPSSVRQKNRLEKAIKQLNSAGHLVQKYTFKASKQKGQKAEVTNGTEEQPYESRQKESPRWKQQQQPQMS